jgi:hypothetical protein
MLNGTSPKTMYLRILASEKKGVSDFATLSALRKNCSEYLNKYGALQELEDQYREVYEIQKGLDKYPSTELEYNTNVTRQLKAKELEEKRRRLQRLTRQLAIATSYSGNLGKSISNFSWLEGKCDVYVDPTTKRVSYKCTSRRKNFIFEKELELIFDSGILVEYKYIVDFNNKPKYLDLLSGYIFSELQSSILKSLNLESQKPERLNNKGDDFIQNNDFLVTRKTDWSIDLQKDTGRITIAINHGMSQDELQKTDVGTISVYIERDPYSEKSDQRFLIIEHGKLYQKL